MDAVGRRPGAAPAAADRASEPGARRRPPLPRPAEARADRRDDRLRTATRTTSRTSSRSTAVFPSRSPRRPSRWPVASHGRRRRDGDRVLRRRVARGVAHRRPSVSISARRSRRDALPEPVRRVRCGLDAGSLARRPRRRLHDGRHRSLRVDGAGERTMLYGTPIEERDPETEYPAHGLPLVARHRKRRRRAAHDDALRRRGLARIPRSRAAGRGRAGGDRRPRSRRASASSSGSRAPRGRPLFASSTTSTAARGCTTRASTRRPRRSPSSACSWARASSQSGVLHGLHYDTESGRFAVSFCTRRRPTQLYVLAGDDASTPAPLDARARARHSRPSFSRSGEDAVVRVSRRPAGLGAPLPPVGRARIRGAASARLLRPRRAAEPGAPELRLVLDAAHPDPHARGLRRLRPERPRLDRLRPRLLEARRPRLGRARPARPRPRDDRGAAAGRAASTSRAPASSGARTAAT